MSGSGFHPEVAASRPLRMNFRAVFPGFMVPTLRGRGRWSRLRVMHVRRCGLPLRSGCLIAAAVLGCCFRNLESLLNGATPDPSVPVRDPRDPDAVARLKLTRALQRARYAIAWERCWPHLARLLTVAGLFLVVSW